MYGLTDRTSSSGKPLCSHDIVDLTEEYIGDGYEVNTEEELGG